MQTKSHCDRYCDSVTIWPMLLWKPKKHVNPTILHVNMLPVTVSLPSLRHLHLHHEFWEVDKLSPLPGCWCRAAHNYRTITLYVQTLFAISSKMSIFNINFSRSWQSACGWLVMRPGHWSGKTLTLACSSWAARTGRWSRRSANIVTEKVARLQTWEPCLTMFGIQYSEEEPTKFSAKDPCSLVQHTNFRWRKLVQMSRF